MGQMKTLKLPPEHIVRLAFAASVIALTALVSGCGGGGGGSSSDQSIAPPPVTPPPVTPPPQGPAGTLDTAFGTGGIVNTPFGTTAFATSTVVQSDRKIIAAGYSGDLGAAKSTFALIRYNADGTLDSGFGSGGKVVVPSFIWATAQGVAMQPDGKIVAAGQNASSPGASDNSCALVRFNTDGSPDTTFGVGGVVLSKLANATVTNCAGPVIMADGQIVIAAAGTATGGTPSGEVGAMRFNKDGSRDGSFGAGGAAVVPTIYVNANANSIAVQPDGKIIVGGWSSAGPLGPSVGYYVLARFDTVGVLDPGFNQTGTITGTLTNNWNPAITALLVQTDGKFVAVISGDILRFLANGTPDPGFGVGGMVAGFPGYGGALQSNGKIVVAGQSGVPSAIQPTNFGVWRFDASGALDPGFGTGGSVTTPIGIRSAEAQAVAIETDGRIVVVGAAQSTYDTSHPNTGGTFAVARYFGDPVTTSSPQRLRTLSAQCGLDSTSKCNAS